MSLRDGARERARKYPSKSKICFTGDGPDQQVEGRRSEDVEGVRSTARKNRLIVNEMGRICSSMKYSHRWVFRELILSPVIECRPNLFPYLPGRDRYLRQPCINPRRCSRSGRALSTTSCRWILYRCFWRNLETESKSSTVAKDDFLYYLLENLCGTRSLLCTAQS